MSLTILSNKPTRGTTEETLILDLTYPSRTNAYDFTNSFAVVVKPNEAMRPDLLSVNFFGNPDYYDMILKTNGISNPFSIDPGEVYFAPELNELINNNAPSGQESQSAQSIINQYVNPDKASLTDTRLSNAEAQRLVAMTNKASTAAIQGNLLPPNVANTGDREITVKGGKIYFGKDVVNGKQACAEPLSKSEFLARLIKNRIQ